MRVFLILLIAANLGYLAWWQGWIVERPVPVSDQRPGFQPAGQRLILLSELPEQRLALMDSLARAREARGQAQAELRQLQGEVRAVAGEIDENQQQLAQDQARSAEVQQALLATLDAAESTVPWCAEAGVFADRPAAQAFLDSAAALGLSGVIEARQEPVASTWWVHMPPFATEAEAMARLQELQAKNIDSYYMRTGEMAGGISLGVYSREESARIGQQQLAGKGYETSIREVFRMGERFYVQLRMPDASLREAPEWTGFLSAAGGIEVLENACQTIAPGNEFP